MTKLTELFNKNIFWESLKQSKYVMVLHSIALFILTTMVAYMTRWEYNHTEILTYGDHPYTVEHILDTLTGNSSTMFFIIIVAVLVTVYVNFSYLFKSNSVQFYNSMPLTRSAMYISKAAASFVSLVIPAFVILAVNIFIYYGNMGIAPYQTLGEVVIMSLNAPICYIVVFSTALFGVSVACNSFSMIFAAGFVSFWHYATLLAMELCLYAWFEYYDLTLEENLSLIFPPFMLLKLVDKETGWQMCFYIFSALYIALLIPLGILCYKRRKSENTNKFIAFDKIAVFFKYYVSIIGALGFGAIFANFEIPVFLTLISYGVIFVLLYCLLQAMFEKSMQSLFKNIKKPVIASVCLMVIIAPFICGLWQPGMVSPKWCKSVEIYNDDFEVTLTEKESIEKTIEFLSTEGGYDIWLKYDIELKIPFLRIVGQDWHFSAEKYEEYIDFILSSEEYFNHVEDSLLRGMNFEIDSSNLSWMCYDSENVKEFKEYIPILMDEMRKYDYQTKKDSGVWGFIDNKESDLNIRIYNCYKDFILKLEKSERSIKNIEKAEGFVLEVMTDKYEDGYSWGDATVIYRTEDKEIIKKFDDAVGLFWTEKTQPVYIRISRYLNEEELVVSATSDIWTEYTVNYYDLPKELREIINPQGLSYWELAKNEWVVAE